MLRDITLGQYYPADSWIHRLDPRVKAIMASDFALNFDQSCWDVLHYWGGKLSAVRADGLENHTMLTISRGKPFRELQRSLPGRARSSFSIGCFFYKI